MKVLIVIAHPVRASFNRALLEKVKTAVTEAGHEDAAEKARETATEGRRCRTLRAVFQHELNCTP